MEKVISLFCFSTDKMGGGVIHKKRDDSYYNHALNLIKKLKEETDFEIYLLTDNPEIFESFNINVFKYEKDIPSYSDKLEICKIALEKHDTVLYLDVDCLIAFNLYKTLSFEPGFHYFFWWRMGWMYYEHMPKDNYFKKLEDYCRKNNYEIDKATPIHESIFLIRKSEYMDEFFDFYDKLKDLAIENDMEYGNVPTGRAEGLLMSIALMNTRFNNNRDSLQMRLIGHTFYSNKDPEMKHLRPRFNNIDDMLKKTII